MVLGRFRSIGVFVVLLGVALAVLGPVAGQSDRAGAAGRSYKVHTWTDPDGNNHRVRWNPCQTITYSVNVSRAGRTAGARSSAVKDVRQAFHRAANRTGLTFAFEGRTNEIPREPASKKSWADRQRSSEIVVAWVDQSSRKYRSNLLGKSGSSYPSGVGGWMLKGWTDSRGHWQAAVGRGFVVVNAAHNKAYRNGFGSGTTRGALLLHEIGHSLGLDHVGSTNELMYPTMLRRAHSNYKAGDTVGLHKVGKRQGCIPLANEQWPRI